MADEHAADGIVIPLLVHWPHPAFGLVELVDVLETPLVSVVAYLLLKQCLVEIEPGESEGSRCRRVPAHDLFQQNP